MVVGTPIKPAELGIPGLDRIVEVGRGDFCVVYRARQTWLRRRVAVQVLDDRLSDEASVERFAQLGTAMEALSVHPNIVAVYDHGLTPNRSPYVMLEHLAAGAISERRGVDRPLTVDDATRVGVLLAGALESAHLGGILHLNVTPASILLDPFAHPKLADFDIAGHALQVTASIGGTARNRSHAAPEVLGGAVPTAAADTYGLASTMHELCGGARIATEDPADLTEHGVPDEISAVLAAGMAQNPAERPTSTAEFGTRLNEARVAVGLAPVTMRLLTPQTPPPRALEVPPGAGGFVYRTVVLSCPMTPANPRDKRALASTRPLPRTKREPREISGSGPTALVPPPSARPGM